MIDTAVTAYAEPVRDWPERAVVLATAGALIGLALHFLLDTATVYRMTEDTNRLALAALLATSGVAYGFVVVRTGHIVSGAFALVAGLIVAGVIYWNGIAGPTQSGDMWRLFGALLTVAIAAPLFQAWRGARSGAGGIPYAAAHNHAWTDVVLWFAAWLFVGVALALAYLLSELFSLIGLKFLRELLDKPWFFKMLLGLAFGGAVGLLRDRERILGTLQRVVTTVLAVLAPVLAIGLLAFLAAMPFTGLAPLWGATKSTTPILLSCIIGALILANAVLGDLAGEPARSRLLRWAAMALGVTILPLAVIAAVSIGFRIDQHGLTPDRLWAVVFTGIACAYGVAYLIAITPRRTDWAMPVRIANLRLALGLCGVALVLSTPLVSFGAISTRDQLARLDSGRTPIDKFDWRAMRFDFGPTGKAAVAYEAKHASRPDIRKAAAIADKSVDRSKIESDVSRANSEQGLDRRLVILPVPVALPADLRYRLTDEDACGSSGVCAVIYTPEASKVFVARVLRPAAADTVASVESPLADPSLEVSSTFYQGTITARLTRTAKGWADVENARCCEESPAAMKARAAAEQAEQRRQYDAIRTGAVEVRSVQRRQIFVGGRATGMVFDDAP